MMGNERRNWGNGNAQESMMVKKFQKIYFIFKLNPNLGMSQVEGARSAQVWFRKKNEIF